MWLKTRQPKSNARLEQLLMTLYLPVMVRRAEIASGAIVKDVSVVAISIIAIITTTAAAMVMIAVVALV